MPVAFVNVNGQNFICRARIQSLFQHRFGNPVRIFQHLLVGVRRTDGRDDALAHPRDDGLLAGPTHQPVDIGPHRHPAGGLDLDAVLGHGGDERGIDHLGICLLYTSPSPRDLSTSRMPSSA